MNTRWLNGESSLPKYFDREGNTLTVWFDDPKKEHVCEESDDDIVLVKDRRGRVIGFAPARPPDRTTDRSSGTLRNDQVLLLFRHKCDRLSFACVRDRW